MKKAILIPANPNRPFLSGQPEGSIPAHEERIRAVGAVFWRLMMPGDLIGAQFPHDDIRRGYLYDVGKKEVTHRCDVPWIRPMQELSWKKTKNFFLEDFKSQERFDKVSGFFYVVSITGIHLLKRPRPFRVFNKYGNGQPVKIVRNYCIIQDPNEPD